MLSVQYGGQAGGGTGGMIYSVLTFNPEGLHNSSYFRGSVAARSYI